jgi:hypothetical protein
MPWLTKVESPSEYSPASTKQHSSAPPQTLSGADDAHVPSPTKRPMVTLPTHKKIDRRGPNRLKRLCCERLSRALTLGSSRLMDILVPH